MFGKLFQYRTLIGQQLLSKSSVLRSNFVLSYGVGLVAFMVALGIRLSLEVAIPDFP
jgi:hypothetical protein